MNIKINDIKGVKKIILTGRFDASAAAGFKESIRSLLQEGSANYVVDLHEVDYIDSGGLGSLVSALRQTRSVEGDIRVSGLSGKVRSVFELTRLHRIFEVFDDSPQAVKSYHAV